MNRIILFKDTGELGNRLITYSFLLSFGREYKVPITNLCFWRYARYFERHHSLTEYPWIASHSSNYQLLHLLDEVGAETLRLALDIPKVNRLKPFFVFQGDVLCRPQEVFFRGLNALMSRLCDKYAIKNIKLGSFLIKEGAIWDHHSEFLISHKLASSTIFQQDLVEKHAQYLRDSFKPQKFYQSKVDSFISSLRQEFSVLVGVHIRRGDYSSYRNGKWYFSNRDFLRWMEAISSFFQSDKVGFVLASNEKLDPDEFYPCKTIKSPGHFIVDMYSLAACDLIIGPPSTFSGWASFVGGIPICFLEDKNQKINSLDFEVWKPKYF
jgi:hypothetical protein